MTDLVDTLPLFRELSSAESQMGGVVLATAPRFSNFAACNAALLALALLTALMTPIDEHVAAKGKLAPVDGMCKVAGSEEDLHAVFHLSVKELDKVRRGQRVELRFGGFPAARFGVFTGTVSNVSDRLHSHDSADADPIWEGLAMVALEQQAVSVGGRQYRLQPGMHVDGTIRVGEDTALSLLLEPHPW